MSTKLLFCKEKHNIAKYNYYYNKNKSNIDEDNWKIYRIFPWIRDLSMAILYIKLRTILDKRLKSNL